MPVLGRKKRSKSIRGTRRGKGGRKENWSGNYSRITATRTLQGRGQERKLEKSVLELVSVAAREVLAGTWRRGEEEAYQGRWREGARDAMAGRSQLLVARGFLILTRARTSHTLLFYYPERRAGKRTVVRLGHSIF
jgi:hypothetical protein